MLGKYHELMQAITDGALFFGKFKWLDTNIARQEISLFPSIHADTICFHMGDLDDIDDFKILDAPLRLPFDKCWFEGDYFTGGRYVTLGAHVYNYKGVVRLNNFLKVDGVWSFVGTLHCGEVFDGNVCGEECHGDSAFLTNILIARFLSAIACKNVSIVDIHPPEKLQKKRLKNGKQPLFTFKILNIGQPKGGGSFSAGDSGSVRVHLRRGHPRQYLPGKWTWVQPCVVGDKKKGIVHKDYQF